MSKRIESPVERWPGFVVLHDPLTFPMTFAFEDALAAVKKEGITRAEGFYASLDGILPCVEKWEITGEGWPKEVSKETFPSTPRNPTYRLINWLIGEITNLFLEAENVPNE